MNKNKQEYLNNLRHSCAHLMAAAVTTLWPEAKPTLGPAIENGFYYDFDGIKISESELTRIEQEMAKIVKGWKEFKRKEVSAKEARIQFKKNEYKLEMIGELEAAKEKITIYQSGDFVDLCRGGHIDNPRENIKYFKLLSVAGAYWRGDEKNKMLTRIYGTAFATKKDLEVYLKALKEADEYNHRKIGKELELFANYPEIGQGLPVWLPKGYAMRRVLEDYMLELERQYGYEHILSPHISREELFKISGHLGFYDESMYKPIEIEDDKYYLKPMNCPAGMLVFKRKTRSWRELPIKLGEIGTVYRFEKSGELHGLQRVRGFTQNDAHIFCAEEALTEQVEEVMEMMERFYHDLRFENYRYVLAISDPDKKKFKVCGTRQGWKKAESVLRDVLKKKGIEFEERKGDAAFYGPKIDIEAVNVFGKADAISTVQIDFNLPERFGLEYINDKGEGVRPMVIHRALVGSFERFFAFFIEYYRGAFPVWISPVQAVVLPITDKQLRYAKEIFEALKKADIRVELDERNETLSSKIRDAQMMKVPYMIIAGAKEEKEKKIAVRIRNGEDLGIMSLEKFIEDVKKVSETKQIDPESSSG